MEDLKKLIREVPDFPKPGILFRDISTLLLDPHLMKAVIGALAAHYHGKGVQKVAGMESRGFLVGLPLALALGVPFLMLRKPNKLPGEKASVAYGLEYGSDRLEVVKTDVIAGENILVVDDLLATGGTAKAASQLLTGQGAKVAGYAFIIELVGLGGREKLLPYETFSLVQFEEK